MQVNNVPVKYLSKQQAKEYKKLLKEYESNQVKNQKTFNDLAVYCDIAEKGIKENLNKSFLGKYYLYKDGTRYAKIVSSVSEGVVKALLFDTLERTKGDYHFGITAESSFSANMLPGFSSKNHGSYENRAVYKEISKTAFENALKVELKRIEKLIQ